MDNQETVFLYEFDKLSSPTGNIFASIKVIGKRAEQIAVKRKADHKEEIDQIKWSENGFYAPPDSEDEVLQTYISKKYEILPSPIIEAIQEILDDKLSIHNNTNNAE